MYFEREPFFGLNVERGEGVCLIDSTGRRYLNFSESINVLGYSNKRLVECICSQVERLVHFTNMLAHNSPCRELAGRIVESVDMKSARLVYTSTGSEANEYVLSRLVERGIVVGVKGAYHGLLTLTEKITLERETDRIKLIEASEEGVRRFRRLCSEGRVSGVVLEILMVHAGVVPLEREFVLEVVEHAQNNNIAVVVDEVYTGLGKTGYWYAFQKYGLKPNAITLGKSLGGGLPLAAIVYDEFLKGLGKGAPGGVTTSQGGNVTACRAGLCTFDILAEDGIVKRVRENERKIAALMQELLEHAQVRDVRGWGYIWGVELNSRKHAHMVSREAFKKGLLLTVMGHEDNVLRFSPPLTAGVSDWERAILMVKSILNSLG